MEQTTMKDKKRQCALLTAVGRGVLQDMMAKIAKNQVPATWDGHELRCWLAETAQRAAASTELRRRPRGERARNYRNTIIVNNL